MVHLGFGAENRLIFSSRPVAWPVCALRGGPAGWSILDCREPVYLDGRPVSGLRPLSPGARLELGRVTLRVASPSAPPAPVAPIDDALEAELRQARASKQRNLGRYLLLSELGSGAFSTVHRAWDEQAHRFVAVKELVQLSPGIRERFAREARLGLELRHPHVAAVLDHGERDRRPYLVMDLLEGRTLEAVAEEEPLPLRRAVALVRDVAAAIAHAHGKGVLHRDLKPQNVLVGAGPTGGDHAWVVDFGLARLLREEGPRLTTTGALIGTPLYLAPEQAQGEGDERSDVYSLGALLYFALTGESPLDGSSLDRYLDALMRERPDPPSRARRDVDAALDAVCLRCLEKDPALRYPSAAALEADLERWLAGAAFTPTRAPLAARLRHVAAKHALRLQLAAVGVCFLVASAVAIALVGG